MDKPTQREIILKYLELLHDWTPSYRLLKQDTPFGWLGSGSDRIARYLAEEGKIERKQNGKYSYYRYLGEGQLSII